MSSPSPGILKTHGVNSATTLGVDDTTGNDNINNSNRRSLVVSPSVQFSESVAASGNANGGDLPPHCDDGVGGIVGTVRAKLNKVRVPLDSCRAVTLKIIHCRLMLMAICALVVIECACVMSELMVDLHGIKLRFDNEAEEINKFVAHFKNKHPDAFESVELRRMKDFMHLLKTSTTPTSMDAALCQVCHSDSNRRPYTDHNDIPSTIPTVPPVFKTKDTTAGTLPSPFPNSISSSDNSLNNVDSVEYLNSKTVNSPNSNDEKLSLIKMKQRDRNQHLPVNKSSDGPKTGKTKNQNHSISSTTQTPTTITMILSSINSNDINHSMNNSTPNKDILSIKDNSSPINVSRVKEIPNNSIKDISSNVLATNVNGDTTNKNITNSTLSSYFLTDNLTGSVYKNGITQPVGNYMDIKNPEQYLNESKRTSISSSNLSNVHLNHGETKENHSNNNIVETSYSKSPNDNNYHGSYLNSSDRSNISPQQSNQNRTAREKLNYAHSSQDFRNKNTSSSSIQSIENLFILAINNVKENFFLIAELLPNHVKKNGSLHSRYMNEYRNIYKTSKALHYTSLTILGIMVIETALKLFCTGCGFFKNKLEVFDAIIVVVSFSLDLMFLDSRWYETGKDATALLVLLLPWRVVRIVNSFVMTIKHKHQIQMINLKRGKKKAELKTAKVQTLLKEIRKDVQLLVNLCKAANVDENSINACLYGKGRSDGVTQTLMETCASLVLISTLGKNPRPHEDDIYGTLIQEVLDPESTSHKSPEKQQEEEAAIDAAIALDDKIEARRKSSRRKPSLSIRLQTALLKRSHTIPRRCASLEIPDTENGTDVEGAENNVFYIHEETGDIVPEGDYVIIDGDGRYYIRDIILPDEDGGSYDGTPRSRNNTSSEL